MDINEKNNGNDICVGSIEERVKNYIQTYNGLKRNKDIVKSIDKDYFFDLVDCLIKAYKELEEENKRKNIEPVIINNKMYFIDKELYIDLLKDIKTDYIPTSVIQNKIEEVNNSSGYSPVNKIFIEKVLQEILEEGRR